MGDTIVFTGTSTSSITNSNPGLPPGFVVGGITFDTSAFYNFSGGGSLTLGGDIIDNSKNHTETFSIPITLSGNRNINVTYDASLTLGNITDGPGSYGLTKTGGGTLTLSGNNTIDGALVIQGGVVVAASDARLGNVPSSATPGAIVLDGGALRIASSINATRGIALGNAGGGSGTLDISSASYNGTIADNGGTGTFIKTGGDQSGSSLSLGGINTYTGATIINQGALKLDFTSLLSPSDHVNILYHGNNSPGQLILGGVPTKVGNTAAGGGDLIVQAKSGTTSYQTFGGLTLNQGNNQVNMGTVNGGGMVLALGAITHNAGGNVSFILPSSIPTPASAFTTTTTNVNGILGGWATIAGALAWAANDGAGNIIAYNAYTATGGSASAPTIANNAATNVQITGASTGTVIMAASGVTDINTLQITDTAARTIDIGSGNTLRLGSYGAIWRSAAGASTAITINNGTLTAGGAANTAGEINLIGRIFESGGPAASYIINSTITDNGSGAVRLIISGTMPDDGSNDTGTTQLNTANSYSGGTYVNSGVLIANNAAALGSGAVTIMPGAQVILNTPGTVLNDFFIAGNTASNAWNANTHAALRASGVLGNSSSTITLLGDATIGSASATAIINSKITGGYNVTFEGPGTITLTNTANDYVGNTSISKATLQIGAAGVIPHGGSFGDVIFLGSQGTLDLNGFSITINGLASTAVNSTLVVTNNAASGTAILSLGDNNVSASFGGNIQDGANAKTGLTKIGNGIQSLVGTNTYSGATTVSQGVLLAANSNTFSPNSAVTVNSGATLRLGGRDNSVGSLAGLGFVENASIVSSANTLSIGNDNTSTNFGGIVQNGAGIGPLAITKNGSGTQIFSGANTYTGDTNVNGGVLQAGSSSAFGLNSATTVASGATLRLAGNSITLGSLSGAGTVENTAASAVTLATGGLNSSVTFSGVIQNGGSGAVGLSKNGGGTLTLAGANTYTGPTVINSGAINVTGSITSAVTVEAGAKFSYNGASPYTQTVTLNGSPGVTNRAVLAGSGTFTSPLALDNTGDVLAPGNSPGTLTFVSSQTWQSFTYDWETNNFQVHTPGITHDQIAITGSLNLTGGTGSYVLNVISLTAGNVAGNVGNFGESPQTWQILTTTGGITGFNRANWTLDTSQFSSTPTYNGSFDVHQNGNNLELVYTPVAVPEPSGALLIMVLGLMGILKRKWRR
jgi:autotransporter-associated beta strand protein